MATVRVQYGGRGGRAIELETANDLMVVRTCDAGPVEDANLSGRGRAVLDLLEPVVRFADAGVQVFHVRSGAESDRDIARAALKDEKEVRFAGRVLADPVFEPQRQVPATAPGAAAGKTPVLYSENLFVQFAPRVRDAEARRLLESYALKPKRAIRYLQGAWFVEAPEGIGLEVFDVALRMLHDEEAVELCHPEVLRPRDFRAATPREWHLHQGTVGGVRVRAHANVVAAWGTTQGAGTTIAVIDTGIDIDHLEFASAGKIVAPFNATSGTGSSTDPRPRHASERHGTACAGVACADGVGGASGVAPAARLMPIRLMSALGSQDEADAIAWAADNGADVISCSWGPPDGPWDNPRHPAHRAFVAMPDSTRLAVEHALTTGRGGKGCVICFAAGNGNESVDNDGYASHPGVVAVAACNDRGTRSVYSDTGAALVCAFPSNDFAFDGVAALPAPPPVGGVWLEPHPAPLTPGIWTTDRTGAQGYNRGGSLAGGDAAGHFTNGFGGTSSACPGVAGIAALVLSVNPDLGHAEVKALLGQACDRIDTANGRYHPTTGHSPLYGFGRINAASAVALAAAGAGRTAAPARRRRGRPAAAAARSRRSVARVAADPPIRDTGELSTLSFTIAGAPIASVFVRQKSRTEGGEYVALSSSNGAHRGSITVAGGDYEYTVLLQGGRANGRTALTLRRDQRKPVDVPVLLDGQGNGGRVGAIHVR